jgi:Alginate export
MKRIIILIVVLLASGIAQETKSQKKTAIDVTANWRGRGEFYNWFDQDPAERGNYAFGASTLRLGVSQKRTKWDWLAEIEQPSLFNLPKNATLPAPQGALGLGANYFSANTNQNSAFVFLKQAYVRLKFGKDMPALRVGRFDFIDGTEVAPKDATLASLKKERIAHRLIGNFAFSHVGRSFDGADLAWTRGKNNLTLFGGRTTQGVFSVNGMPDLDVNVEYAAYTRQLGRDRLPAEVRAFAVRYEDQRSTLKVDNRNAAARTADHANVLIGTYGIHYLQAVKTRGGDFDLLFWGALQNGRWGSLAHKAGAFATETGYQPKDVAWKPWLRVGYFRSSGDSNPTDNQHGTFFQILPTPRIYARFPFYNAMNSQDEFAQLQVQPTEKLTVVSGMHWLQLANRNDLWYSGGGAYDDKSFGYAGRTSNGRSGLANVFDLSATYRLSKQWAATAYVSYANGGAIIDRIYGTRSKAGFGYVELAWTLPQR